MYSCPEKPCFSFEKVSLIFSKSPEVLLSGGVARYETDLGLGEMIGLQYAALLAFSLFLFFHPPAPFSWLAVVVVTIVIVQVLCSTRRSRLKHSFSLTKSRIAIRRFGLVHGLSFLFDFYLFEFLTILMLISVLAEP